jgi:hypothetical protein
MENIMDASAQTLTVEQAYQVMLAFLEREVELTESLDLADLLAGYKLGDDGQASDPALWDEWMEAVGRVRTSQPD